MQIRQMPRVAARTGFRAARFPLTVAETVLRRDDEWLPTRAYETVESRVKQVVGRAVRDNELVEEGILEQAKASKLGKAAALESAARQEREQADASFDERREADEKEREEIAAETAERKEAAERERAEKKRQADATAAEKARAAQEAEAASKKAVAKHEREARHHKVKAEREAVHDERRAVEAEKEIRKADEKLEAAKAARRSSS
jgi:hypothetical protein